VHPATAKHALQTDQHRVGAVGKGEDSVNKIRSGEVEEILVDTLAGVGEEWFGLFAEELIDAGCHFKPLILIDFNKSLRDLFYL
jgi:hypothetical protein